ncbi:LicD family protein [Candidatus Thioglobus sp.]|uniref:LicD family protein n=1 Tax=Candidatus Thioglobus sp. TaxID=2026721 RepID=UPI0026101017|nr:LicD family protein [Candidatus Thioglobus sp.]MDG2395759.1 LicD family protein [Candidatus Thioglobus sp.]
MGDISQNTLRKAQLIILDMLIEFDSICKKHDLKYWLDSGTLLGAVRYQGFIPWDDDIDLSMPVEDYNKFKDIAADALSDKIFFQTKETDKSFKFDYIKLRSNKAKIVEWHEKDRDINYHQGVFVDIFPMLSIDNSAENKIFYDKTLADIRSFSSISLHTPNGIDNPLERTELTKELCDKHQEWEGDTSKVIYGGEMPDVSAWFDLNKVLPLKSLEFEGTQFPVPNDCHHYLTEIYTSNYTQTPPKEKRKVHAFSMEILTK